MDIIIILLFLGLFIALMYIMNTYFDRNFKNISKKEKKKATIMKNKQKLMVLKWRFSTLATVFFIFIVLILNRGIIFDLIKTKSALGLLLALLVFFISFIAIVAIDIILPEEIGIAKRAAIEISIFFAMYLILFFVLLWV